MKMIKNIQITNYDDDLYIYNAYINIYNMLRTKSGIFSLIVLIQI